MTQARFYPRYALSKQGLEDQYEVIDADGFVVSEPKPWEQAAADARARNDLVTAQKTNEALIHAWLPQMNFTDWMSQ